MPLYIPWLTETIKKRGVRYLLHHYLGQFFEEKLTLEQLSIDIYEGKGSIKDLALDVNGLNDELDFIPFKFLDGCLIGQISVEVPWSSLATDACKVELQSAKFVCVLKTKSDGNKAHCTESTLLTRSLMTSSMQMAEDIVSNEDEEFDSPASSMYRPQPGSESAHAKKKDANQMFEGLEMFAQLIDSVLRRTKLTARDTIFQIRPSPVGQNDESTLSESEDDASSVKTPLSNHRSSTTSASDCLRSTGSDEYQDTADVGFDCEDQKSKGTVEFFIKFFKCEEILEEQKDDSLKGDADRGDDFKKSLNLAPDKVTKQLTLEDVEMRIGGVPVSNLIGKHTIVIKFTGQKSEISVFLGSPLLAVIGHEQLETFFKVFNGVNDGDQESKLACERDQKIMSPEDYAKIEDQLLETASFRAMNQSSLGDLANIGSNHLSSQMSGRRWVESSDMSRPRGSNYCYYSPHSSSIATGQDGTGSEAETTLDNIEAFSCELKIPGIWLCILRDGEALPSLIKPYADSINSFHTINKYIDKHMKVPHIRLLALKVALDLTSSGINVFLGDLDISEHLKNDSMISTVHLLHNDTPDQPLGTSKYKASIINNKEITVDMLTNTRVVFDPTIIDRIVYDYKLINFNSSRNSSEELVTQRANQLDLSVAIKGDQFKLELLCPIPDLTNEACNKPTQLRPQSFLFDFVDIVITWQSEKLNITASELMGLVKTQPQQEDEEAVRFVEAVSKNNDKISLVLEPSPSKLDTSFPNEIDEALNQSSMYDSIYVSQATESKILTDAFQTKRRVVGTSSRTHEGEKGNQNDCDNEKILTPGDRQHLTDYLKQMLTSTKLSLNLHLPFCDIEFEGKEQLDLIYNRFGNDFVFWQPKALTEKSNDLGKISEERLIDREFKSSFDDSSSTSDEDSDDEAKMRSMNSADVAQDSSSGYHDNEVTCKITVGELTVKFNHQSCAAALQQEVAVQDLLMGVVIDIDKKPNTMISMVADHVELSTDSDVVLEGNTFGEKTSTLGLTVMINRPSKTLKDIKLAIQIVDGLFNDFKTETYKRFWQSINVTDEPILGYNAPKIATELHINVLNTSLSLSREGARPALLSIDDLYITSMVVEATSEVMIRLIADEVSFYLKRNGDQLEIMKNYVCLIDSGLIDLNVKISPDGRLNFSVINNVITVRACQDSLSALFKLINIMMRSTEGKKTKADQANLASAPPPRAPPTSGDERMEMEPIRKQSASSDYQESYASIQSRTSQGARWDERRASLLEDAMNEELVLDDTTSDCGLTSGRSESEREYTLADEYAAGEDYNERDFREDLHSERFYEGNYDEGGLMEDRRGGYEPDESGDGPPLMQTSTSAGEYAENRRDMGTCLLDASNPSIGDDFLGQPLLPFRGYSVSESSEESSVGGASTPRRSGTSMGKRSTAGTTSVAVSRAASIIGAESIASSRRPIDESGFFIIGDDDVGAGIIDKQQREPVIRKLVDGPINIIENHFKMTRPRTIPDILVSSLERYVLEEMTLVVNLFGGRDFDDSDKEEASSASGKADDLANNSRTTSVDVGENNSHGMEHLSSLPEAACSGQTTSGASLRSRSGSLATQKQPPCQNAPPPSSRTSRRHCSSESTTNTTASDSLKRKMGTRQKHMSEGARSGDSAKSKDALSCQQDPGPRSVRFGEGAVNLWESLDLTLSSAGFLDSSGRRRSAQPTMNATSKLAGGTWRQNDSCIQLTLTKVKLLYELGDQLSSPISWRFMLFIHDIEVRDRLHASDINKMLYEYCNESMPRRNTPMLMVKNVATINASDGCEECDLHVSLKPFRLNIDQDTLLFLIEFFGALTKSLNKQQAGHSVYTPTPAGEPATGGGDADTGQRVAGASLMTGASSSARPAGTSDQVKQQQQPRQRAERGVEGALFGGLNESRQQQQQQQKQQSMQGRAGHSRAQEAASGSQEREEDVASATTQTASAMAANQAPIYIKSFTFSPDVPIRLDYHAKHLDFDQGALAGILMGLAHLDHSELVLRRVQAKHGMRGLDRVFLYALNSWMNDIKRNQLPSILSGVGPMHSVIQLFQGMRDLVWMPIDHYRKDRRLVRGFQRGASSFSSSTAMAAINLMNRFISLVQCTAQIAHDIVTPPSMLRHHQSLHHHRHYHSNHANRHSADSSSAGVRRRSGARSHHQQSGGVDDEDRRHQRHHHRHAGGCGAGSRLASASAGLGGASSSSIAALNQPRNFCEGVAVGFTILKEGFNDTARNVAVGMQAEDMRSAVGELVRQIPSTLLNPIISATEGAQNVLMGIRNQIAPDARREDQEKWKRRVRG